jgi:hypothetical protein
MNISFQKKPGNPALGITFFWRREIKAKSSITITDHFIPELFFDYFFVREGKLRCSDEARGEDNAWAG